ncbi:MAG: hypothetical protein IJX75_00050 [Clostridia bacterium]|nr:hypothetical protein [Clostridia bacterium]
MKLWKKTAAFLLCLGFSFSAVGCDMGGKEQNSTPDSSSSTESSVGDSSSSGTVTTDPLTLVDVLSTAKSALVEFDVALDVSAWQVNDEDVLERVSANVSASVDMIVSETEDGDVAAKLTANLYPDVDSPSITYTLYYVDGLIYSYNGNVCVALPYNVADMLASMGITPEQTQAIMDEVLAALESEGVTSDSVNDAIMDIFETGATLENGAMLLVLDAKEPINAVLGYLNGWTEETTLGDLVNEILAIGVEEGETPVTYDVLLAQLATENIGDITVGDLYEELDGFMLTNTGKDIQDWKDELIANDDVLAALAAMEMPAETITEIAELDIETALADYMDWTMDDLLAALATSEEPLPEGEEPTPPPTVDDVLVSIENVLDTMTISDVVVGLGLVDETQVESFFAAWEEATAFRFNTLASKMGIRYDKQNNVDGIVFGEEISLAGEVTFYSSTGASLGKKDVSVEFEASLVISEFSSDLVSVALPENVKVLYTCIGCGEVLENGIIYDEAMCAYICDDCAAVDTESEGGTLVSE